LFAVTVKRNKYTVWKHSRFYESQLWRYT